MNSPLRAQLEQIETLPRLSARAAERWPEKVAWRFGATGRTLTFAEVEARSDAFAGLLHEHGIREGDPVAVMLANVPAFALLWFAIAKVGAVIVPLNVNYRSADAGFVLAHSEARLVFAASEYCPLLDSLSDSAHRELIEVADDLGADLVNAPDTSLHDVGPLAPVATGHHLLNIQYTSGTTGQPKGCMLEQGFWLALARQVMCDLVELGETDVIMQAQPFHYIDPQWNVVLAMLCGAELVLLDRFHPATFWDDVRAYRVTFFYCIASMPTLMLKTPPHEADLDHRVRLVACSAIPPALHAELEARWGVQWLEIYGTTETGITMMVSPAEHDAALGNGCIGRAVSYREVRLVDDEGVAVAPGGRGEIVARGPWILRGYFKNPEATSAASRDGWWHTGDLARCDEQGRYYYVSRDKDMIRRSGENIAAMEVEGVLEEHPAVLSAACVPVPDAIRGEEVKVYLVLRETHRDAPPLPTEIAHWCAQRLAYFKVPRYWSYVDRLPRTASQRVAKPELVAGVEELRSHAFDRIDDLWR